MSLFSGLMRGIQRLATVECQNRVASLCDRKLLSRVGIPSYSSTVSGWRSLTLPAVTNKVTNLVYPLRQNLLKRSLVNENVFQFQQVRTRVYQSWRSSRPKTVRSVPARFKRLGNGLWIRTRAGRHKHLWKKSRTCHLRMKTHVICNKRQTWLLERLVGKYWKRHRHYPNDPYAPYHIRNNFSHDICYKKAPFYP